MLGGLLRHVEAPKIRRPKQVAIQAVSETTESNAASSEELAASAEQLGAQSQTLQDLVAKFEI